MESVWEAEAGHAASQVKRIPLLCLAAGKSLGRIEESSVELQLFLSLVYCGLRYDFQLNN